MPLSSKSSLTLPIHHHFIRASWSFCQVVASPLLVGLTSPVGLGDFLRSHVSFQQLPPALASFSGFLVSLSTSRDAIGSSSALAFTSDGIASPGNPLLRCSPPSR